MWKCRKCDQRFDVVRNICPACGGIVEAAVDDRSGPVLAIEREAIAGSDGIGMDPRGAKPPVVVHVDWTCPGCGEEVPGNFDVCWKCLTTKSGTPSPNAAEVLSQAGEPDRDDVPDIASNESAGLDDDTPAEAGARATCPRCHFAQVIRGVSVLAPGCSGGKLSVVVYGNPAALVMKDALWSELEADVCGNCGHVELRVADPQALFRHMERGRDRQHLADVPAPCAVPCRVCGMLVLPGSAQCPHCGHGQHMA